MKTLFVGVSKSISNFFLINPVFFLVFQRAFFLFIISTVSRCDWKRNFCFKSTCNQHLLPLHYLYFIYLFCVNVAVILVFVFYFEIHTYIVEFVVDNYNFSGVSRTEFISWTIVLS
jgi:hypothetical protein